MCNVRVRERVCAKEYWKLSLFTIDIYWFVDICTADGVMVAAVANIVAPASHINIREPFKCLTEIKIWMPISLSLC